ncbi:DUF3574 domain-containing protein [Streptomyces sp. NBC_00306]|uniref:DUF3574 domain-containing protein n=1 Tax=Streptomyces sp. NBC_00306 TaxID=2975708 RepID=UPI002E28748A|nr:DUF3574 domain-containing protein [Streptomyces sp. NBC_00306]
MPTSKQRSLLAAAGAVAAVLTLAAPSATSALDGPEPKAAEATAVPAAVTEMPAAVTEVPAGAVGATATAGSAYVETRLFFGTERPDGGPDVTDEQFMAFVDRSVTPGFPDGLTVQDGRGQWRDANGTIERERSYELTLLYPASQARARGPLIERIREAYRAAYGQESVARLDEATLADF